MSAWRLTRARGRQRIHRAQRDPRASHSTEPDQKRTNPSLFRRRKRSPGWFRACRSSRRLYLCGCSALRLLGSWLIGLRFCVLVSRNRLLGWLRLLRLRDFNRAGFL